MKRAVELRPLSHDHHRALMLAKRAKEAAADEVGEVWQMIQAEYETYLAPHFAVEEDHLLPAVRQAGGAELCARVLQDHDTLRGYLNDGPHDKSTLAAFGQCLFDHVRFEERSLFPFAEAHLSRAELAEIQRLSETPGKS